MVRSWFSDSHRYRYEELSGITSRGSFNGPAFPENCAPREYARYNGIINCALHRFLQQP